VIMREAEALRAARAAGIALNGSGKATIGRSGMGKVMVKHKSVKIIKQFQSYLADTIVLSTPPGSMNCTASTSTKALKSKPIPMSRDLLHATRVSSKRERAQCLRTYYPPNSHGSSHHSSKAPTNAARTAERMSCCLSSKRSES